jgi:hypothetical protein
MLFLAKNYAEYIMLLLIISNYDGKKTKFYSSE